MYSGMLFVNYCILAFPNGIPTDPHQRITWEYFPKSAPEGILKKFSPALRTGPTNNKLGLPFAGSGVNVSEVDKYTVTVPVPNAVLKALLNAKKTAPLLSDPIEAVPELPAPFWSMKVPDRCTVRTLLGSAESIVIGSVSSEHAAKMTIARNTNTFFMIDNFCLIKITHELSQKNHRIVKVLLRSKVYLVLALN